jgi:hypothetical protein
MAANLPVKLRKRGFFIVKEDNSILIENEAPLVFNSKEEAESYIKEKNISGIVK